MTAGWAEWPAAERDAGSNVDETFLGKWKQRQDSLKDVEVPPWEVSQSVGAAGWTFATGQSEIWVPPYATRLHAWLWLQVTLTLVNQGVTGHGKLRLNIGGIVGPELPLLLRCLLERDLDTGLFVDLGTFPGADGHHTSSGAWFQRDLLWEPPTNMLGTHQTMQLEYSAGGTHLQTFVWELVHPTTKRRRHWRWEG